LAVSSVARPATPAPTSACRSRSNLTLLGQRKERASARSFLFEVVRL
jgi:hypothetical protein